MSFHVCSGGLLPDIMHDVLEGALQYEVKLILKAFILEDHYFTLEELNTKLEVMELGYMESKDRPTPIAIAQLRSDDSSLSQSAAQMWLLGKLLPVAIGSRVPADDERWVNFVLMLKIVGYLFSPKLKGDDAAYLQALISDHHEEFCHIYPSQSVIPKMHFMVHMPRLMLKYGPLVRHWTMRYEAKHSYFKQLARLMGNFINIQHSLAMRHQLHQCYLHSDQTSSARNQLSVGPGKVVSKSQLATVDDHQSVNTVFQANWAQADGHMYKRGAIMLFEESPQFGQIQAVYVVNGIDIVLKVRKLETITFMEHYHAYRLQSSCTTDTFLWLSVLPLSHPMHLHNVQHMMLVVLPYHVSLSD